MDMHMPDKPLRNCLMKPLRRLLLGLIGLATAATQLGGCPPAGLPLEFIEGGTGGRATIGDVASVTVFSPVSDLAITGGTPVQVNWQAIATTRSATVDLIFDLDQNPDNDNEITSRVDCDLGIFLIRRIMHEVDYEYKRGFINKLVMTRFR